MSCKAAIYTANTGAQALAVGGTIGLGSIIRRFGNSCCNPIINLNGSGITPELDGDTEFERVIMSIPTDRAHMVEVAKIFNNHIESLSAVNSDAYNRGLQGHKRLNRCESGADRAHYIKI